MSKQPEHRLSVALTDWEHQELIHFLFEQVLESRRKIAVAEAQRDSFRDRLREIGVDFDNQDWWTKWRDLKQKLGIKEE